MDKRKFLVVVDPSHERHIALERMIDIIKQKREWELEFHILIGVEIEDKTDPNIPNEVICGKDAINELLAPLKEYEAKYTAGVTQEICPARIDADLTEKARTYAVMAHEALGCKGYSRTDLMLSGRDLFVLETNTIPGMTATSLFPQAATAAGLPFGQLLDRLIELSLECR